jgi:hypothetical protein
MPRFHWFSISSCALAFLAGSGGLRAGQSAWTGVADTDFENAANWSVLPANDLTSDVAVLSGLPAANQPQLSAGRSINGLLFSSANGGWLLGSEPVGHVLALGSGGISSSGQSNGSNMISAGLSLEATQTWQVGSGGFMRVTGAVRTQESVPLAGQLIVGAGSNSGTLVLDPAPGKTVDIQTTLASAATVQVNQRLDLGSTADSTPSINQIRNTASAGIRVGNAGVLTLRSGTWKTNDLGSNNTGAFSGTLKIEGGTLATGGGRYAGQVNGTVGTRIHVSGGELIVAGGGNSVVNSGYLGLGVHGANTPAGSVTMDVSGGLVDVARGTGILPAGVSSAAMVLGGVPNTTVHVNQSGGTVRVGMTGGSDVFSGAPRSNNFINLSIGSNALANHCGYTLTGGTLLVAGSVQGLASPEGISNFNFLGGTLAAGAYDATHLGHSPEATVTGGQTAASQDIGTLVNRGGILAPGGIGTAGRTVITGSYTVQSGALAIDLGGTIQATSLQNGQYDHISISGATVLGGDLIVHVLPGFTPSSGESFTILTSAGALSGNFANAPPGTRLVSANGLHTFIVTVADGSVVLSDYQPVMAPVVLGTSAPSVISEGDAVVLGITAESNAPLTYEWSKGGVLIEGANSSSLTLLGFGDDDAGTYEVTVSDAAGSVTRSFNVRITTPPSAGMMLIDAGASHTFSAAPGAASHEWILDGETVGSSSSFVYQPVTRDVGTHWLRVVETHADTTKVTRHWTIRVRIPLPVSGLEYHVSPNGSDSASGGSGAPFATLEKARDVIRALPRPLPAGGVTIYLRGGVHRRASSFVLSPEDSGTEGAPIVYAAYPGETPVLTSGRVISSAQWSPLAASEHARVAPGVDAGRIWEVNVAGNARANAFPAVFNEWTIFNALRPSLNGGLLEVFHNGERMRLSRYPNHDLTNDILTASLTMNGVAAGAAADGSGYLNGAGTYTPGSGGTAQVGGAFHYNDADADRVSRWQSAINNGGLWLAGYWRVPWQLNGVRVSLIDPVNKVIGLATNPSNANNALVPNGIGDKYTRPAGSKKEPWWALNLLEELDQPGEWCIDFNRQRLYFLMDRAGAPADGEIELSDTGTPLFQLNGASDIRLQGLRFRRHLGINVQVLNGARNLILDCEFIQSGNMAVDINGGTGHGVVSSDFEKLASGGIMLRGGISSPSLVPSGHFAVNNRFRSFSEVVRVYQAAIDVGYGGPMGNWGLPTVGMRVAHNDVRTSPHAGILWNGHQHVIEYNELSDYTRISNDFGGIYRFGPNFDSGTVIRYNHLYASPQGEGIYNDMDHVRTPIYGNTVNLKTPPTSHRGYGFWTNTNTIAGASVPNLPMTLQLFNNIAVNSRSNYSLHSAPGGRIENNVSYRKLSSDYRWFRIATDTATHTNSISTSNEATLASGPNPAYATDPGFIDFANDDLRLRPDSRVYQDLPGFTPVPLEMSGLYNDEFRGDATIRTPFVVTGSAISVGANSAIFTGTLVYPQFDANATVRVYWGTSDGGTDPGAWQYSAILGSPASGHIAHTRADLEPATRYFFRFHAENAAGEHWAEHGNSTTTFPLVPAPTNGNASADSASAPAANVVDGDPATAWQTEPGEAVGTLIYQIPDNMALIVTRYALTSAADNPAADPRDWHFQGSYDGITWITLDSRSGESFTERGQTREFSFASNSAFRFYRLVITANHGDPGILQLAELGFYGPDIVPDTTGPVIITPGNLAVSGDSTGAHVNFEVSASDAISGNTTATADPPSGSFFPLGVTTVTVTASDAAGNVSSVIFTVTVSPPSLPAPWSIQQIQPFAEVPAGTVTVHSTDSFTISGTGGAATGGATGDLWSGTNDSNTYVSIPWQGDGVFTARVATFTSTDASAKAGIVFRETSNAGSRYSATYMIRNTGGAAHAQHKTATNGASNNVNFFTSSSTNLGIPRWIRLVRQGDSFTCHHSPDGIAWTQLGGIRTNPMSGSTLSVGLVVAPRTGGAAATATFDHIRFLTPLQIWRQTHFNSIENSGPTGDTLDPDGDGYPNLLEYAFGINPNTPDPAGLFSFEILDDHLTLDFPRISDPMLSYHIEASSSLTTDDWTEIWQSTGAANVAGMVSVPDVISIEDRNWPRRFLRLRVSIP